MSENNLNNDPNQASLLASIVAIYGALRGTVAPRDAAGVVGPGAADLGSAINPWDRVFCSHIIAGAAEVDVAALAQSAPVFVFRTSDASWLWPATFLTRAIAMIWSAESGGGGGGEYGGGTNASADGEHGGIGIGSTLTVNGIMYGSGDALGGRGGFSGGDYAGQDDQGTPSHNIFGSLGRSSFEDFQRIFAQPIGSNLALGGLGGLNNTPLSNPISNQGGEGGPGGQRMGYHVIQNLAFGDSLNIVVSTNRGAAGAGGTEHGGAVSAGSAGTAGQRDGLIMLFAAP